MTNLWCWLVGHDLKSASPNHWSAWCDRCGDTWPSPPARPDFDRMSVGPPGSVNQPPPSEKLKVSDV